VVGSTPIGLAGTLTRSERSGKVPKVGDQPFKEDEWAVCLKVLEALVERPDAAPDRERIERLVARLYRKTRGGRRKIDAKDRRLEDRRLIEGTGRVLAAPVPDRSQVDRADTLPTAGLLTSKSRRCYICKDRYREVHHHYHLLCPSCARLNQGKRLQRADLSGRRAIVTGGRIKIGYEAALKLLRDGAEVLVTTRFPIEAALRYAREPDFGSWEGRLRIERLDFRSSITRHKRSVGTPTISLRPKPWSGCLWRRYRRT
jgi:hypothetical protein